MRQSPLRCAPEPEPTVPATVVEEAAADRWPTVKEKRGIVRKLYARAESNPEVGAFILDFETDDVPDNAGDDPTDVAAARALLEHK